MEKELRNYAHGTEGKDNYYYYSITELKVDLSRQKWRKLKVQVAYLKIYLH